MKRGRYERSLPRTGVSQEIYDKVVCLAERRNRYMTDIMRLALRDYLNRIELRLKRNPNGK